MNSSSKIAKMATIFVGSILSLLVGMVTAPIITRLVDPNEYGQLSIFTMYTNIFSLCISLGLERAYMRFFYDTDKDKRSRFLYNCIKYTIGAFGISLPVIFIGCNYVKFDVDISGYTIGSIFAVNLLAVVLDKFALNVLRVQQKSLAYAICSVSNKLIYGITAIVLVLNTEVNDLLVLILSTALASLVSFILAIISDRNSWSLKKALGQENQWHLSELFIYSLPIMFQGMVSVIFQSADKIMIKHFGTYSDVGIYASAAYYVTIFMIFNTSINTIVGPEMYKYNAKNPEKSDLFVTVNKAVTFLMFFVSATLILSKDFLVIILGEKYRAAGMIMPFLMFNPVMTVVSGVNAISIEIKKNSKYFLFITIISAIANIFGNYLLIPIFGAKGAAISTGLSYILYYIITTAISKKLFSFNMSIIKFSVMTVLMLVFALYNTWNPFNLITIIGYAIIMLTLLILYKESIKYIKDKIFDMLKRKRNI